MRIECRLRTIAHYLIIHPYRIHSQGAHQLGPLAQELLQEPEESSAMLKLPFPCRRH